MNQPTRTPQQLLTECEKITSQFSKPLMIDFLKEAETYLMDLADRSKSNNQQLQLMDICRGLKQKRTDVDRSFQSELTHGFALFRVGKLGGKPESSAPTPEDAFSSLSLVTNDNLEVELAQSSFARRAEMRYAQDLYALNQRLSVLNGGKRIADDGNPVGPAQFASCFQKGIALLAVDIKMTTLFYRLFEKNLLTQIGTLYASLNQFLIQEKILANLRYTPQRNQTTTGSTAAVSAPAQPSQDSATAYPPAHAAVHSRTGQQAAVYPPQGMSSMGDAAAFVPHVPQHVAASVQRPNSQLPSSDYQQQLYNAIQSMQQYVVRPPQWRTGHGAASANELVSVVHQTQEWVAGQAGRLDEEKVQPCATMDKLGAVSYKLQQQVSHSTGKNIDDEKASTIDLVGMIFETLLGDGQLPNNLKAVLSYLHTPYIKIAFLDPELFAKPEHPARQLLNALEEAGAKWVNNDGSSQFKAYPKIKSIVRSVLTDFDNDLSLIESLRDDMREFNLKTENNVRLLEQRETQKAEGEDRLRQIKLRIHQTVKKQIEGKKLPSPLIVLILHPWSEYLTFVLLRHGDQSEQWKEGLEVIDNVIWSIQPKANPEEQKRLVVMQDKIQEILQAGFDTIAYDQAKAKKLLESIREMQSIALQNRVAQSAPAEVRTEIEATAVGHAEAKQMDVKPETAAERELVEKLRIVEFGTWMDFDRINGETNQRLKIAWFNAKTLHYMLVNRAGKQVAVMSAVEIARHMLSQNARIISGLAKPFFERALENIFTRMQSEAA